MQLLFRVRNDVVHYRMKFKNDVDDLPKYVKELEQRKIALPKLPDGGDFIWIDKICSTEGIRWAHNTACRIVHTLAGFAPNF